MDEIRMGGVTINVHDLEAAKAFYAALPGARCTRDESEIATYHFGTGRVSLRRSSEPGFHLEMEASDTDQTQSALERSGVQISDKQPGKFFLFDPQGTKIEIECEPPNMPEDHGGAFFNPERDEENAGLG